MSGHEIGILIIQAFILICIVTTLMLNWRVFVYGSAAITIVVLLVAGVAFLQNVRQPLALEKAALEIACPISGYRQEQNPQMRFDCGLYSRFGLVRSDFK